MKLSKSSRHLDQRLLSQRMVFRASLCIVVALLVPSCALNFQDREYAAKLAKARTDCRGDEIVGVWVSKFRSVGTNRVTVLFRPDGTGRERTVNDFMDAKGGSESALTWRYAGGGVWNQTRKAIKQHWVTSTYTNFRISIRYTGSELLKEEIFNTPIGVTTAHEVFVRADDEAAVEEHLKKR
jgi:hypothetical protein